MARKSSHKMDPKAHYISLFKGPYWNKFGTVFFNIMKIMQPGLLHFSSIINICETIWLFYAEK